MTRTTFYIIQENIRFFVDKACNACWYECETFASFDGGDRKNSKRLFCLVCHRQPSNQGSFSLWIKSCIQGEYQKEGKRNKIPIYIELKLISYLNVFLFHIPMLARQTDCRSQWSQVLAVFSFLTLKARTFLSGPLLPGPLAAGEAQERLTLQTGTDSVIRVKLYRNIPQTQFSHANDCNGQNRFVCQRSRQGDCTILEF